MKMPEQKEKKLCKLINLIKQTNELGSPIKKPYITHLQKHIKKILLKSRYAIDPESWIEWLHAHNVVVDTYKM